MLTVLNGLFNSKIIYGLQLLGKVRLSDQDPQNAELESIQLMQNKLVRFLKGKTIADRICTESLLSKANILSVNQQYQIKAAGNMEISEYRKLPTKNTETRTKTKYAIINQSLYRRKTNRAWKKNLDIQNLHQ